MEGKDACASPKDYANGYCAGYKSGLSAALQAVSQQEKPGREWVPGSFWDTLINETSKRIQALKDSAPD